MCSCSRSLTSRRLQGEVVQRPGGGGGEEALGKALAQGAVVVQQLGRHRHLPHLRLPVVQQLDGQDGLGKAQHQQGHAGRKEHPWESGGEEEENRALGSHWVLWIYTVHRIYCRIDGF